MSKNILFKAKHHFSFTTINAGLIALLGKPRVADSMAVTWCAKHNKNIMVAHTLRSLDGTTQVFVNGAYKTIYNVILSWHNSTKETEAESQ